MNKIRIHKERKQIIYSFGLRKHIPFCDNAHREHNKKNEANYKSVQIIAEETVNIDVHSSTWNTA